MSELGCWPELDFIDMAEDVLSQLAIPEIRVAEVVALEVGRL